MFISVSLAAAFGSSLPSAQSQVDGLVEDIGRQPGTTLLVAGAVRHGEYDYYQDQFLAHAVLEARDVYDAKSDHEFTDRQELAKVIGAFIGVSVETIKV